MEGVKGSHRKMVFGKWKFVKGGRRGGKKAKRKGGKRRGASRRPVIIIGTHVYRVKKLTNCSPSTVGHVRCDVETFKKPVRSLKQATIPGISGLGRRMGKRGRR